MHWYTGRKIYLEYNMILALLKKEDVFFSEKVDSLIRRDKKYVFPYSPAHIEEVATIYQDCKDKNKAKEYVKEHLNFISVISDNLEFLPNDFFSKKPRIIKEHPCGCMQRVINMYNLTLFAQKNEEFLMSCRTRKEYEAFIKQNPEFSNFVDGKITNDEFQEMAKINKTSLCEIAPLDIFNSSKLQMIVNKKLKLSNRYGGYKSLKGILSINDIPRYATIKDDHPAKEEIINFLIKSLHSAGYHSEHKNKSRSFMHDISHAIYASKADFLVNDDNASRQKVKAVYAFLNIPCIVLSKQEFIEQNFQ